MLATISIFLISNTTNFAPMPIDNTQVAFIDSLLNSMTKGEGALKHTCYQVRHTSEATSFIEQEQCRKAQKEVNFAKRQYPKALSFIQKYQTNKQRSLTETVRYLSESTDFINDCKTEKNIRAAKTMRYWGTDEVGDWKYTNLNKMGADSYKSVLTACEPGSWVYASNENAENEISNIATDVGSRDFVQNCDVVTSKNWTTAQQNKNINTYSDLSDKNDILAILAIQLEDDSASLAGIDSNLVYSKQKQIKKSSSYCKTAIAVGEKSLADQKREKARALAAKQEADRQYRRAKEAQRRAAAAEARRQQQAAAAEALRQQNIQNANEGVVLE